jgi:hypothetical protein
VFVFKPKIPMENVNIFYGHLEYLWVFGIFSDHSVHTMLIWYNFSCFGIMHQEKSGNPVREYVRQINWIGRRGTLVVATPPEQKVVGLNPRLSH